MPSNRKTSRSKEQPAEEPDILEELETDDAGVTAKPTRHGGRVRERPTSLSPEDLGKHSLEEATEMEEHEDSEEPPPADQLLTLPDELLEGEETEEENGG